MNTLNTIKKYTKNFLFLLFASLIHINANAQIEMADKFREDGKIYVVVLVMLTVFIGIVIYLISLDRKIRNIEKNK